MRNRDDGGPGGPHGPGPDRARAAGPSPVCGLVRESVSASLDGETPVLTRPEVDAHLRDCAACVGHVERLAALDRTTARGDVVPAPARTQAILAALGEQAEARPARRMTELRVLVGAAGVAQLLLALPLLLGLMGPDAHAGRDLGALQLALGVGFLVAALQPHRAVGVLPVGIALAGAVLVVATADVVTGQVTLVEELTHLGELVGVAGLWALARRVPAAARPSPTVVPV